MRANLEKLIRPRDLKGPTNERVLRVAQRVRLGVASTFAVVILFVPAFSFGARLTLSLLAVGYALVSGVLEAVAERHPGFPAWIITPLLGIAVIFVVTLAIPETLGAALFFYVLGIIFYTCLGGMALGVLLSVAVMPFAVIANVMAPGDDAVSTFTLVMFLLLLPSVAVIIEGLTQERRRTAARLARLHDALQAVTVQPDLQVTLDSIVASAGDAIGADAVGILLREDDHLVVAAPSGATDGFSDADVQRYTGRELAMGEESPLARAMVRLEPVVVADIDSDEEFPRWTKLWGGVLRRAGFRSLVAVPLHTGTNTIGVLSAVFERRGALEREELVLLDTYAEQVSLVIARAQAYDLERQAAEQLAETARLRRELLSVVSHELRTPLTVVKGFVDTLLQHWDGLDDERRQELLQRVSGNADELTRLVNQLLDFARIDAGQVKISPAPMVLVDGVAHCLGEIAPIVASHVVHVDIPDDVVVLADQDAFCHILVNLVTNAVRHSPEGSIIEITSQEDGDDIVVAVADHGIGIAPEDQPRVFERFFQSGTANGAKRGTGIGLAIARDFTVLQGGRIWVDSTLGEGATFSFTLSPVPVEAPPPVDGAPPRAEPAVPA
jgi:signal transduction histidine kinase